MSTKNPSTMEYHKMKTGDDTPQLRSMFWLLTRCKTSLPDFLNNFLKIIITELKLNKLFGDNNELMKLYCNNASILY